MKQTTSINSNINRKIIVLILMISLTLSLVSSVVVNAAEVLVKINDSGYSETGTWKASGIAGYNKTITKYTNELGATAVWNPGIKQSGNYTVSVWKVAFATNDKAQYYEIIHNGKTDSQVVDFSGDTPEWIVLGTFDFSGNGDEYVKFTRKTKAGALNSRIGVVKFELPGNAEIKTEVAPVQSVDTNKTVTTEPQVNTMVTTETSVQNSNNTANKSFDLPEDISVPIEVVKESIKDSLVLFVGSPMASVNGVKRLVDTQNSNVMPVIKDERTLVPVRLIAESFGGEVSWDENQNLVSIVSGVNTIKIKIGEKKINVNGSDTAIDTEAIVENGRTLLPLRAISEALSKKVFWFNWGLIIISDDKSKTFDEKSDRYLINEIIRYLTVIEK